MITFNNFLFLVFGLGFALFAITASAQNERIQTTTSGTVLSVPEEHAPPRPSNLPRRGMTKAQVRRELGTPERIHAPVGKPPITRWDYPGFHVYFEYDLVLHDVVPGDFPPIRHRNQLTSGR